MATRTSSIINDYQFYLKLFDSHRCNITTNVFPLTSYSSCKRINWNTVSDESIFACKLQAFLLLISLFKFIENSSSMCVGLCAKLIYANHVEIIFEHFQWWKQEQPSFHSFIHSVHPIRESFCCVCVDVFGDIES